MELKNKAGLALALAAIFTTGGANVAFAALSSDNVTNDVITVDPTDPNYVDGEAVIGATGETNLSQYSVDPEQIADGTIKEIVVENYGTTTIEDSTPGDLPLTVIGGEVAMTTGATIKSLTLKGVQGSVTGDYVLNTLVADADTVITVGLDVDGNETDTPGSLEVTKANLNGGAIFADPTIVPGEGFNPSMVTVTSFADDIDPSKAGPIDGVLIAGQNSSFTIGDSAINLIDAAMSDIGYDKWTNTVTAGAVAYNAAMAFVGPQTIDTSVGGLTVNGWLLGDSGASLPFSYFDKDNATQVATFKGKIDFADNSLAVFDLTGVSDTVAALTIDGGAAVTIGTNAGTGDGKAAGVYFANAVNGEEYMIFDGATSIAIAGDDWGFDGSGDNLYFNNGLLTGTWANNTSNLVLTVERNSIDVQDVYTEMSDGMAAIVDGLYGSATLPGKNATEWLKPGDVAAPGYTDNAAVWFISNATDKFDHHEATAMLEGAAQIAVAGGVPYLANNIVTRINNLIVDHNDMLNATQPAYGNEPGQLGIWATPFYGMSDVDGMDAGRLENGFELSYGGAAFGLDYNVNEAFRLGAALNVGGGSSDADNGSGDFYKTENDFDFFGASLYGSYTNGAFGLTGDLGFSGVDSEITQNTPLGNLKSDVDSNVFTLGLTGKYRFVAGENLNVAPHLGLRYTQVSMDDAKVTLADKGTLFNTSVDDMGLFQIPLGIEFSSTMVTDGGWTVTPHADLGVLFTMGDTDVDTRFTAPNFPTTPGTGVINAEVIDEAAFTGTLGIKATADNGLSLGLDYGILASGNQTDHQFTGMLRFEF